MTDQNDTMPDVIKYLLGEGTLDGWGFGEQPAKLGKFWWRSHLRDAWKSLSDKSMVRDILKANQMQAEKIRELKQERDLLAREFVGFVDDLHSPVTDEFIAAGELARKIVEGEKDA